MSIKLPAVTVSDAEYEELARHIGRHSDYVSALKAGDVSIADKIAFRAWYLHRADADRCKTVDGLSGPSVG